MYDSAMDRLLRHWINGRFGWGRRVVKIYLGDDGYRVDAIHGSGDSAQVRSWTPPTEEDAVQLADELMIDSDGWREIRSSRRV